ncbi:MAG: excinuclease ABC subunit UvrC [Armatimonadota bacterium]
MINKKIKQKLKYLPALSGVYLFKDVRGKVIYVGSSASLKKRITSYFKHQKDLKTQKLTENIKAFDYIATDSLKEALILEYNLIKKHKPRYNIKLKDDKKYPFIEIAVNVRFPYIRITRNITNLKSAYFGPYTNVGALRKVFYTLRKIFTIRTCKEKLPSKRIKGCLYNNIKLCSAPCLNLIKEKDYNYNVEKAVNFLAGNTSPVLNALRKEVKKESKNLNFERCALLQNIINRIMNITEKQKVFFKSTINADYIGTAKQEGTTSVSILQVREGRLIAEKNFIFSPPPGLRNSDAILYFIRKMYSDAEFMPAKIYTSIKLTEEDKNLFREEFENKLLIYTANRGTNKALVALAEKNAGLKILSSVKETESGHEALVKLKELLVLNNLPAVIKAVDISNISGKFAAGSVICFAGGKPHKKLYRHYIIKGETTPDDYAMIEEVLERNLKDKTGRPDLLIIDGGKGQLSTALKIINKLNISNMDVISIAKREELIYAPHLKNPIDLSEYPKILNLVRYIRDEAHRFALKLHKKRRRAALKGN